MTRSRPLESDCPLSNKALDRRSKEKSGCWIHQVPHSSPKSQVSGKADVGICRGGGGFVLTCIHTFQQLSWIKRDVANCPWTTVNTTASPNASKFRSTCLWGGGGVLGGGLITRSDHIQSDNLHPRFTFSSLMPRSGGWLRGKRHWKMLRDLLWPWHNMKAKWNHCLCFEATNLTMTANTKMQHPSTQNKSNSIGLRGASPPFPRSIQLHKQFFLAQSFGLYLEGSPTQCP